MTAFNSLLNNISHLQTDLKPLSFLTRIIYELTKKRLGENIKASVLFKKAG
jgi:hypothetical protein